VPAGTNSPRSLGFGAMVEWISIFWLLLSLAATSTNVMAQGHAPEPGYQDDRSTAEAVIGSYHDAVNRRENTRAYSYWEPAAAAAELPPFDQFVLGYGDTASVDLTLGDVGGGVGAGQLLAVHTQPRCCGLADPAVAPIEAALRLLDDELTSITSWLAEQGDPVEAAAKFRRFGDLIQATPSLWACQRDMTDQLSTDAAQVLARRIGTDDDDPEPQIAARALLELWHVREP
jgi:MftR C-terminal domain